MSSATERDLRGTRTGFLVHEDGKLFAISDAFEELGTFLAKGAALMSLAAEHAFYSEDGSVHVIPLEYFGPQTFDSSPVIRNANSRRKDAPFAAQRLDRRLDRYDAKRIELEEKVKRAKDRLVKRGRTRREEAKKTVMRALP